MALAIAGGAHPKTIQCRDLTRVDRPFADLLDNQRSNLRCPDVAGGCRPVQPELLVAAIRKRVRLLAHQRIAEREHLIVVSGPFETSISGTLVRERGEMSSSRSAPSTHAPAAVHCSTPARSLAEHPKDGPDATGWDGHRRTRTRDALVGALVQRAPAPQPLRRHAARRVRSSLLRCPTSRPAPGWKPITRASIRPRAVQFYVVPGAWLDEQGRQSVGVSTLFEWGITAVGRKALAAEVMWAAPGWGNCAESRLPNSSALSSRGELRRE
jgi:hypothetical protein